MIHIPPLIPDIPKIYYKDFFSKKIYKKGHLIIFKTL